MRSGGACLGEKRREAERTVPAVREEHHDGMRKKNCDERVT